MKTINLNDMMPEMQFSFEGREYTLRCSVKSVWWGSDDTIR